jgi:cytochrome b6-f complex iron-sulfur subunit
MFFLLISEEKMKHLKIMERREFLKRVCLACGAIAVLRLAETCEKYNPAPYVSFTVDITDPNYSALENVGGYVYKSGVIIMCTALNSYHALSQVCTHAGCTVQYDTNKVEVICPCHQGTFTLNGDVVSGPPPSALRVYKVSKNGNILTITA